MSDKGREAANWALIMLLLGWIYSLNGEVNRLKGILEYYHGEQYGENSKK